MANLSEAFEEHLRSLNDDEWNALSSRVRAPIQEPSPSARPLPNEQLRDQIPSPTATNPGLAEAVRRGYIDKDGNPTGKAPR